MTDDQRRAAAERIVARGCPTVNGYCPYCGRRIAIPAATGGAPPDTRTQPHRDDCCWPPFAAAFS